MVVELTRKVKSFYLLIVKLSSAKKADFTGVQLDILQHYGSFINAEVGDIR